jgi:hypothetical protein
MLRVTCAMCAPMLLQLGGWRINRPITVVHPTRHSAHAVKSRVLRVRGHRTERRVKLKNKANAHLDVEKSVLRRSRKLVEFASVSSASVRRVPPFSACFALDVRK